MSASAPGPPDKELVALSQKGDRAAFGVLCERYYSMVSILAYQKIRNRTDAEDLVQESFVRAYRAIESLREGEKFPGWLYRITLKICLDHLRKVNRRDSMVSLDEDTHGSAAPEVPASELEAREEHSKVSAAIGKLPDKYRLVITLRFIDKKSYREIADQLGEPDGTIANRIHRAVKMLQAALDGTTAEASASDVALEEAEQ
ncbi:MAG: RNA polymerase sigma factor [Planctomycetota bacterium]